MSAQALCDLGIVVTRPKEQAENLAQLISAAGGRPILFPVLEILDVSDLNPLHQVIKELDQYHAAIFISPTAVSKAMNLIKAQRDWPQQLPVFAVGRGSKKALEHFGVDKVQIPPARSDSEALLELPELQNMQNKRVVIFRGDGGREVLGDELIKRGAQLTYAECYRRSKPNVAAGALLYHWARNELDAVTVTSSEGLHNLFDLVGKLGQQWLKKTPVFVTHPRVAAIAQELGLEKVVVTEPEDQGLLTGLEAWARERA